MTRIRGHTIAPSFSGRFNTVHDLFLHHLISERRLSENSVAAYSADITLFLTFLTAKKINCPENVDVSLIHEFLQYCRRKSISNRSNARRISALKTFFSFLASRKIVKQNPFAIIDLPKSGRTLPKALSLAEVRQLLAPPIRPTFYSRRDSAMLFLLYSTGLRVSELVKLPLSACNISAGFVRVLGKGNKERLIPFGEQAKEKIAIYLKMARPLILKGKQSNYLFVTRRGSCMTRARFWQIIRETARAAGIEKIFRPI